jgi:endonuclease YncB( thermonuclease family)
VDITQRIVRIMRSKAALLFIAILLLLPTLLFAWDCKIVGITDGDTIKVLKGGKQVKIRLAFHY